MATIQKRKYSDGSTAYLAQVRVKPYKPTSKSFPTKKAAEAWADTLERELKQQREHGGVREDVTTLTLKQLVEEFLADPETVGLRYFADLQLLLAWWVNHCGAERMRQMNSLVLRHAREKIRQGRAPATVNRYLSALRSAWNWGRAANLLPSNQTWPTRLLLTEPKGRLRFLSDDELAALLKAGADHSPVMAATLLVSIGCGVRQSELLRLKWADIDLDQGRLRVMLSKNDESRAVYLPKAAGHALRALKKSKVVGQQVFLDETGQSLDKNALEQRWRVVRAAAKLDDFRWHDLRHSCASFLAQQGANLLEIGSVLGHKSPSVTKRYAHLVEGKPVTGHTELDAKLQKK